MTYDLRWVLVLLANLLLILLVAELNHYLALASLHVFLGGVFLTFGMLRLHLRQAFLANGITALVLDALNPIPFGQTFLLMMICHTIVLSVRGNFARESVRSGLLVAGSVNLVLMVAYSIFSFGDSPRPGLYASRMVMDIALSTLLMLIITPWFLSLQKSTLAFVGIDLDAEQREAK